MSDNGQIPTHELTEDAVLEPLTAIIGPRLGAFMFEDNEACLKAAEEKALKARQIIDKQGWSVKLNGKQYVKCEGWTVLAALCGLSPTIVGTNVLDDGSRAAVAELRDCTGKAYSRADAECGDEKDIGSINWHEEPGYSKRSMAQTRAISKVCRASLSWCMTLAGYEATPYEEVAGRDFTRDKGHEDKLKACIQGIMSSLESLLYIREGIRDDDFRKAAEGWFELDDEIKKALWIAPTKGGPFTKEERDIIKSNTFRDAYYGERDG